MFCTHAFHLSHGAQSDLTQWPPFLRLSSVSLAEANVHVKKTQQQGVACCAGNATAQEGTAAPTAKPRRKRKAPAATSAEGNADADANVEEGPGADASSQPVSAVHQACSAIYTQISMWTTTDTFGAVVLLLAKALCKRGYGLTVTQKQSNKSVKQVSHSVRRIGAWYSLLCRALSALGCS